MRANTIVRPTYLVHYSDLRESETESAVQGRVLSGQSDVCAKTPSRPERGKNLDSLYDARNTAGSLRSPWPSGPILWGPRRSCGQPRRRSPSRSLGNRRRMEASESKPGNPGFCLDRAAAGIVSGGPALSASEAGLAATAHSDVTLHISCTQSPRSVFSWRTSARPGTPQWYPEPGVICLWRCDAGQADRIRPPNSSSQCFQKLQCFWLHSMDCRLGQYIPDRMAFCAIGYRT